MNVVLIVTAAALDAANAALAEMGMGSNSYTIALSPTGSEPATHWGLNYANASEAFCDAVASMSPAPLTYIGVSFADAVDDLGLSLVTGE